MTCPLAALMTCPLAVPAAYSFPLSALPALMAFPPTERHPWLVRFCSEPAVVLTQLIVAGRGFELERGV